jgi:type I restriction enzyme S subunit
MEESTTIKPTKVDQNSKLGEIPEGWTTPEISEVFQFVNTTSFSRNQLNYDEKNNLFYIHYGDIHSTYKKPLLDFEIETNVPKLNTDVVLPNSVQYLKDGDVIIADASEDYEGVGEAIEIKNLNSKTVISGLHTFALRDLEGKTAKGFRTYIFKNPKVKKALKTIATGSKVYGISKGNIQKFKIVLPTLPEQKKIASILNTWDKAIVAQEKLITEKQALKKGLMQQLLTGEKRFPEFSSIWKGVRLDEIAKKKSSNLTANSILELKGIYKVFGANGFLQKIDFYNEEEKYISIVKDGAGVGRVLLCDKKSSVLGTLDVIRSKSNTDLYFLFLLLSRINFKKYIIGSTIPHIYFKDYKLEKIFIPGLTEQRRIAKMLRLAQNEIISLQNHLIFLKEQKKGLMQQLLTGEKRVKN